MRFRSTGIYWWRPPEAEVLMMLATIADHQVLVPASLYAAGWFVLRLLPLVSDRANKRAVRLAKAKNKSK
ncbi:hypothetical protein CH296_12255 [Rhodococcus sp. 14-2496-1d]|nr:hypothetical protein CH296_12255 [Rhodococcus sp. 14-2496-1d]